MERSAIRGETILLALRVPEGRTESFNGHELRSYNPSAVPIMHNIRMPRLRRIQPTLLNIAFLLLATTASASCPSTPGEDRIWANPSVQWLLIGELHGSNESPQSFGNLVCDALAHKKQLLVALERPTSEQPALDRLLTSHNSAAAKKALLAEPDWKNGMDGRASEAMLSLLLTLRDLRRTHRGLQVVAFDAPHTAKDPGARDRAMGRALLALGETNPQILILVLTGNAHAMQLPEFGYDFAAMDLPAGKRISLEVTNTGGEAWTSWDGACGASTGGIETKGKTVPFGIVLDPSLAPYGKVDGVLSLGVPLTSSPPAAGEPSPLPPCRIKFLAEHPAKP